MSDVDKPWTADEIRENAPNWSLQCDAKLLEFMENVSKTIEERGSRINNNIHSQMLDLDRTKISLENATNQLNALQHKQYVENRVYDEDETLANTENVPKIEPEPIEEAKPSMIEALQNALETGMDLMEKYYEKVTYEISDSEDDGEEVHKSVVFRPKDQYADRPLPYLIGSKEWHEKWHIGLNEEDSEESGNENNEEEDSLSSSPSPAPSLSSNVPASLSESENLSVVPTKKSGVQDLFEDSSDEMESKPHKAIDNNSTFRKQNEAAKIDESMKQASSREINANNSIFRQQKPPSVSHAIPTLIDSDPPDLNDMSSNRSVHKPTNLFLEDEQDDIFDDRPVKSVKQSNNEHDKESGLRNTSQAKSINLFDDDENDNFDSFLSTKSKTIAQTSLPKSHNLFDDDDFDDELFIQPSEPSTLKKTSTNTVPSTILSNPPKKDVFLCNLFDDEPPEDDFDILTTKKPNNPESPKVSSEISKKVEVISSPSASPVIKDSSAASTPQKPANLFSKNIFDDDDDDDDFEKLITPISKANELKPDSKSEMSFEVESSKIDKKGEISTAQSTKNVFDPIRLFDDTPPSDDEQLFSNISSKKDDIKRKSSDTSTHSTGEFYNDFLDTVTTAVKPEIIAQKPSIVKQPVEKAKQAHSEKSPDRKLEPKPRQPENPQAPSENKSRPFSKDSIDDVATDDKRAGFLKIVDAFSNPQTDLKTEISSNTQVRQPKKLNIAKMDINVAALLPGAKPLKSFDKDDSPNKEISNEISSDKSSSITEIATSSKVSKSVSQDNVDCSGRLTNLNRNRAKNLTKRPSTRRGRQQQYQKSIQSDEHIDETLDDTDNKEQSANTIEHEKDISEKDAVVSSNAIADDIPMVNEEQISKSVTKTPKPLQRTVIFDDNLDEDDSLFEVKSKTVHKEISIESESLKSDELSREKLKEQETKNEKSSDFEQSEEPIAKEPEEIQEPIVMEPEELIPEEEKIDYSTTSKAKENIFSFLEDQEDDDDFLSIESKNPIKSDNNSFGDKTSVSVKAMPALPAYIDELPPDLDPVDEKPSKITSKTPLLSENALSLFGDDDDEDDDIFDDGIPSSPVTTVKIISSNAFNDDLDNELFVATEKVKTNETEPVEVKENVKKIEIPEIKKPEPEPKTFPTIETPQKKTLTSVPAKTSLFGDDEDDEDLFGGPPPLPEPVISKKPPRKIFSDDSSDDDLFGGGKVSKKPAKSTSITSKTPKNTKMTDKLFSDSEDDDLFGTKSKPKEITSKKVPIASTSKVNKDDQLSKMVKSLSPSAVDNDPLADLLK